MGRAMTRLDHFVARGWSSVSYNHMEIRIRTLLLQPNGGS